MKYKIFIVSDIHIGMTFSKYGEVGKKLKKARIQSLERCVDLANQNQCQIFCCAGDLFHSHKVSKKDIEQSTETLKAFKGEHILVLPGNHDYYNTSVSHLWDTFEKNSPQNVILLNNYSPVSLEDNLNIYPAFCDQEHSQSHRLNWINKENLDQGKINIGIVHGCLKESSSNFGNNYYPMTYEDFNHPSVNLWILGHIHTQFQQKLTNNSLLLCSGTPEPDGMDCTHLGQALIVELDKDSTNTTPITTGQYLFIDSKLEVSSINDLENFINKTQSNESTKSLIRLELNGMLGEDELKRTHEILDTFKSQTLYLKVHNNLKLIPDEKTIDKSFTPDSFPHQLLTSLLDDKHALMLANEFLNEVSKDVD